MSKYTIYYNTRQQQFKALASQWKHWVEGANLSESQVKGMEYFFRHIGKRFGLIQDFKEIGVI